MWVNENELKEVLSTLSELAEATNNFATRGHRASDKFVAQSKVERAIAILEKWQAVFPTYDSADMTELGDINDF